MSTQSFVCPEIIYYSFFISRPENDPFFVCVLISIMHRLNSPYSCLHLLDICTWSLLLQVNNYLICVSLDQHVLGLSFF